MMAIYGGNMVRNPSRIGNSQGEGFFSIIISLIQKLEFKGEIYI